MHAALLIYSNFSLNWVSLVWEILWEENENDDLNEKIKYYNRTLLHSKLYMHVCAYIYVHKYIYTCVYTYT